MTKKLKVPSTLEGWLDLVENGETAAVAIETPGCPAEVIVEILKKFPNYWMKALYNKDLKATHLNEIYDYLSEHEGDKYDRIYVLWHANQDLKLVKKAMKDRNQRVSQRAHIVAAHSVDLPDMLDELSSSDDGEVRMGVARNRFTPEPLQEKLSKDSLVSVRISLLANPNLSEKIRSEIINFDHVPDWSSARILQLARGTEIEVLRAKFPTKFHYYLLGNPNVSEELIQEIISARYVDARRGVDLYLARKEVFGETLELICKNIPYALDEIVKRKEITESIISRTLALGRADKDNLQTIQYLVENPAVTGEQLLPLITERSKKIQKALRARTYSIEVDKKTVIKNYENRDSLWKALEEVPTVEVDKKYTVTSAIKAINVLEFDLTYYRAAVKSMEENSQHEWISIAKDLTQARKIFAALTIRAAELGLITPIEACKFGLSQFTAGPENLNQLIEKFQETHSNIHFELLKELSLLKKLINSSIELPTYTEDQLITLLGEAGPDFFWKVANCESILTPKLLTELSKSKIWRYKREINPYWSADWYEETIHQPGSWCDYVPQSDAKEVIFESHPAALVALHPKTPEDVRQSLRKSSNERLRGFFIENKQLLSIETLIQGMNDKSEYVRSLVGKSPNATIEMLEKLAYDKSGLVRSAVAANPLCPSELKAAISLLMDN